MRFSVFFKTCIPAALGELFMLFDMFFLVYSHAIRSGGGGLCSSSKTTFCFVNSEHEKVTTSGFLLSSVINHSTRVQLKESRIKKV